MSVRPTVEFEKPKWLRPPFHPFLIHDHFRDGIPGVCRLGLHLIRLPNTFVFLSHCITDRNQETQAAESCGELRRAAESCGDDEDFVFMAYDKYLEVCQPSNYI